MKIDKILGLIDLKAIVQTPSRRLYYATQPLIIGDRLFRAYTDVGLEQDIDNALHITIGLREWVSNED